MQIIVTDTAHNSINNLFEYLCNYSYKNAVETIDRIYMQIENLMKSPYVGTNISESDDISYRELIYRRTKNSIYRIIYFISEATNSIYIIHVANCKQDFNKILKTYNYFNDFFEF